MSSATIRAAIDRSLCPGCFFVAPGSRLRIERRADEEAPWELFRGHLLDASQARERAIFETRNIFLDGDAGPAHAPLVSIKWQRERGEIHVTRNILTHGFEAYEDSPGVILSRPVEKWVAELVGTIDLERLADDALAGELAQYVLLAVVGTSRLPITSLESPLPAFSLGRLAYLPDVSQATQPATDAIAFLQTAFRRSGTALAKSKALETALRATTADRLPLLVDFLHARAAATNGHEIAEVVRAVFNGAALSPYTEFADRMIAVLEALALPDRLGPAIVVDLFSYMLRHLCRHLTAFDLTVFHSFGANYPDALFLDALLQAYLRLIESHADLFAGAGEDAPTDRRRRRALRQAVLLRLHYQGHLVPDAPTSMGENTRVLPAPFARVPEEQILQAARRRRRLFQGEPVDQLWTAVGKRVFEQSLADLDQAGELGELGMAVFLDRPLGILKEPGEVDRTPLLSYEAFSGSMAMRRLDELASAGWLTAEARDRHRATLRGRNTVGLPAGAVQALDRPGVVSLSDAAKAAPDFAFLRTTRASLAACLSHYDLRPLASFSPETAQWLASDESMLLVQHAAFDPAPAAARLRFHDRQAEQRLELGFCSKQGRIVPYRQRAGVEFPERLQVVSIRERDVRREEVWLELM